MTMNHWQRTLRVGLAAGVTAVLAAGAAVPVASADQDGAAGHVYVLNNNLGATNSITVFARAGDGTLSHQGVFPIGGVGSVLAFFDGTEGSLIRTPDGRRLFAVDAGSNEISVIDVNSGGLSLVGTFKSGGAGPVSLTYGDGRLYVLNAANFSTAAANVTGFSVANDGTLTPIPGSTRLLSAPQPNPAQVLLNRDGTQLLVTEKSTNHIDVYQVASDGSLSGPTIVSSVGDYPFGMAFDPTRRQELLVDDAITGAVTPYRLSGGSLAAISGPVADHGLAPCWMVITRDGHFAYASNADSASISGYRINQDGTISLLDPNGVTGTTPADVLPLELALSRNSQFLYALDSRLLPPPPGAATLSGWRIGADGSLTSIVNPASITLPFSAIGMTAD